MICDILVFLIPSPSLPIGKELPQRYRVRGQGLQKSENKKTGPFRLTAQVLIRKTEFKLIELE